LVVAFGVLAVLAIALPSPAAVTERVSVSTTGEQANWFSLAPSISADGRFVCFYSPATNLVPGDTNDKTDLFVRDRLVGTTERVSVSPTGMQADGKSTSPIISPDGRWVAFESEATNLVPGDTNGVRDVFVRDRLAGTTQRVSVSSTGEQGNGVSAYSAITPDGRFVAFDSEATNLVPGDTNGYADVFLCDRQAGTTERVSISSGGEQANSQSVRPAISADARFVAFWSSATDLVPGDTNGYTDAFLRDRQVGATERVNVSSEGIQANADWGFSGPVVRLSADGRFLAFPSAADNLVPGDTNGVNDMFLRDRQAGTTERVSLSSAGDQENDVCSAVDLSSDGRFVAFTSFASNLVPGDTNGTWDHFLRDRQTGTTQRVSLSTAGHQANAGTSTGGLAITPDARFVAFGSYASNLVPDDTNDTWDIFVRDRYAIPDTTPPETVITAGPCGQVISTSGVLICWQGSDDTTPAQNLLYAWHLDSEDWTGFSSSTCVVLNSLASGTHTFEVKTKDAAENRDPTPAQCQFTIDLSAPQVSLNSPTHGTTVKGTVNLSATASDSSGIQKVEFYAGEQLIATDTAAPYSYSWDTTEPSVPEGPTEICAKAYANGGKVAWNCILVTIDNTTFDDVPKTMSQWPYIEALVQAGITNGCSAAPPLYCLYDNVTRAQMAKFLCIAASKTPLNRATPTFADVPKAHWAYGYVERLADAASWGGTAPTGGCRIVGSTKYFCPNDPVTREQMAKFLCLAAGKSAMPTCLGTFADAGSGNMFCTWIERLTDTGSWPGGVTLTSGCACPSGYPPGAKCYCPKASVTRGQMAVFIVKAFGITL
jgi:Tol biopolymer transport system component